MKITLSKATAIVTLLCLMLSVSQAIWFYYIPLWRHRKIYGRFYKRPQHHHHLHGHHHGHLHHHGHGHVHGHHHQHQPIHHHQPVHHHHQPVHQPIHHASYGPAVHTGHGYGWK